MDSIIAASARALAAGDALGALKRVALRNDPSALALRGIAMAQLGEHRRARALLRRAARGFGTHEVLARARCVVAEAEAALAMRELGGAPRSRAAAPAALEARRAEARAALGRRAARRFFAGGEGGLGVEEAAALLDSGALVVDACCRGLRCGPAWRPLVHRPVVFALARAVAEAWPDDVDRHVL